ncbi:histidine phosphotransferase ChpT [Methylocella sp. CPCC 101449]|jgi:histidine phosphotransferase ChpT|uniref:histidine phosphotransferase ChpT n=1 Tax=Methylocella sp. CPCC 101449 TaxID=2987531 RepID=UPI00288F729B|nr:histidine phosphotransferase family protein [Methylocella sp. CPCC 101449]MDT2023394.1 histidine phosphotransferase family protein [Methylocella sp. CPCC 101449]HEV2574071.1 histidine phosphotransferase family protein [Beijerinckiaceae bacterium]
MPTFSLDALDLAALLCSKVCHDVISPVGAIINGLEVLEEEKDAEMRKFANDLIRKSAHTASAKLQFCRLAFGAAGSAGASIDTGDAEQVARNLLADDRLKFEWVGTRQLMPKNKVKLILNLCLIASACIPRGGLLRVVISGENDTTNVALEASGPNLRLANGVPALLAGEPETGNIDAHGIQAYYTGLVARACDMNVEIAVTPEKVSIDARPATMAAAA